MNGDKIHIDAQFDFECQYEEGDCHYKNPVNKYHCIGCRYARLVNHGESHSLIPIGLGQKRAEDADKKS
jgi:hypothetical protein